MGIQSLLELTDKQAREEMGEYLLVSRSRIDNLVSAFENGAQRIGELTEIIAKQQAEIAKLAKAVAAYSWREVK